MEILGRILGYLIEFCYNILHNYGLAIVMFTLLTKVILFPLSIWVHKNSIKMVKMMPEINDLKAKYFGDKDTIAEETQKLYKREKYHPLASTVPMIIQLVLLMGVVDAVKLLLGNSDSVLTLIPIQEGGATLLMPLAAGFAALLLTLAQNRISPLQREQVKAEQLITGAISVGISLSLGTIVPLGTGIYWISSNLFSILQQLVLNWLIKPAKYIDYEALAKSKESLQTLSHLGTKVSKEDRQREKQDYKRFFSVANKHLVFYSERSGFYKYFADVIEYLLKNSNIIIHYVTSDPKDQIFERARTEERIHPYYIGEKKLITLMMKMDADIVVMTTPDLDNFYLKRSYLRKDIEYIYMFHGIGSTNMVVRKGAYDHFDTVLCVGQHQIDELRETEELYGLPAKNLVPCGYGMFDNMIARYQAMEKVAGDRPRILIAPSWQEGNILESCIDEMVESLLGGDYSITIRPHPEFIKRFPQKMQQIVERYQNRLNENFVIETDFSSNSTIFMSDLLITDWSGIAYEFSFCTLKPSLFIDTPMKVLNPDYVKYKNQPSDIRWRNLVGKSLKPAEAVKTQETVEELLREKDAYRTQIEELRSRSIFHIGESGKVGAKYILSRLVKKKETQG